MKTKMLNNMKSESLIKDVHARQIYLRQEFSGLGHPAVETTVITDDDSKGIAIASGGFSVGKHEATFLYDGGSKWGGKGVSRAVHNVNSIIAPKLKGMKVIYQGEIDNTLIELDGTNKKSNLGGNATASVSAAVLKAGAKSLGLPLYRYIGGVNANILPVPGTICIDGSKRYGAGEKGGGKPSYAITCYGFKSFTDAAYACWETQQEISRTLDGVFGETTKISGCYRVKKGLVKHDRELWEIMTSSIENLGFKKKIGLQVDVAAATFYKKDVYEGLFSEENKSREDLLDLYKEMVETYSFIILEDPFDEDDFEGHSILTKETGIQIVGDDLFATNIDRLKRGIEIGACNATLIKIPQIGTVTEALNVINLAYKSGYGVMPCNSRGEGQDIADYSIGLNTGQIREGGIGLTANRILAIEKELGKKAKFLGKSGLKIR
jgi:enolase